MKDTGSGASAKVAGREFHNGMVQGKKLYFKVSVDVAYCLSFLPWCDLVLVEAGVTKSTAGISTRPLMILNIRKHTRPTMALGMYLKPGRDHPFEPCSAGHLAEIFYPLLVMRVLF